MRRFIAARLAQSAIIVLLVTVIAFVMLRLAPGEPFSYDDASMTPEVRAYWQAQMGYGDPAGVQLLNYIGKVARGNFGYSITQRKPVIDALAEAIPRTLTLAGISLTLGLMLGIAMGAVAAAKRRTLWDKTISLFSILVYSIPDFWLALIIQLTLAYRFQLLPVSGVADPLAEYLGGTEKLVDRIEHMVLPVLTMTLIIAVIIARFQRAALIDVLPSDYLRTARAKGLPERAIITRHALRNALTPTITVLGLIFPTVIGGVFFVEYIFGWHGFGWLTVTSVSNLDYDVATASVVISGILVATGSLLADVLTAIADPRVRDA